MTEPIRVDVGKQFLCQSLVSSSENVPKTDTAMDVVSEVKRLKSTAIKKKLVNIPIGEVQENHDYVKDNVISFEPATGYIKHVRPLTDDFDCFTEYVADEEDQDWLQQSLKAKYPDENINIDLFEQVIKILERASGNSRDTLPLPTALKLVNDKANFSPLTISKVVPDIYSYWQAKRGRWGKPLSRKYWPVISAGDTNPHLVFRMRDKERYRLRRQHRKNDLESFRKMQQLRREFVQAKNILQLMLERESIQESEFKLEREIFELEKNIMQYTTDSSQQQPPPYTSNITTTEGVDNSVAITNTSSSSNSNHWTMYEPQFRHLWIPVSSTNNDLMNSSTTTTSDALRRNSSSKALLEIDIHTNDHDENASAYEYFIPSNEQHHNCFFDGKNGHTNNHNKRSSLPTVSMRASIAGSSVLSSEDGTTDYLESSITGNNNSKKRKRDKVVLYNATNEVIDILNGSNRHSYPPGTNKGSVTVNKKSGHASTVAGGTGGGNSSSSSGVIEVSANNPHFLGYSKPSILEIEANSSANNPALVPREQQGDSPSKLIHDDLNGPRWVCRPPWPEYNADNAAVNNTYAQQSVDLPGSADDYLDALERQETMGITGDDDDDGAAQHPSYQIRYRLGRSNRLIADRVPLLESVKQLPWIKYQYPTQSRPWELFTKRAIAQLQTASTSSGASQPLTQVHLHQQTQALSLSASTAASAVGAGASSVSSNAPHLNGHNAYLNGYHHQHTSSSSSSALKPPPIPHHHLMHQSSAVLSNSTTTTNNTTASSTFPPITSQPGGAATLISASAATGITPVNFPPPKNKLLPEIALSNRKILGKHLKKHGGRSNTYSSHWSSSTIPVFNYLPTILPLPSSGLPACKRLKLKKILDEDDNVILHRDDIFIAAGLQQAEDEYHHQHGSKDFMDSSDLSTVLIQQQYASTIEAVVTTISLSPNSNSRNDSCYATA